MRLSELIEELEAAKLHEGHDPEVQINGYERTEYPTSVKRDPNYTGIVWVNAR